MLLAFSVTSSGTEGSPGCDPVCPVVETPVCSGGWGWVGMHSLWKEPEEPTAFLGSLELEINLSVLPILHNPP